MDLRKLAVYIISLGLAILVIALLTYAENQPIGSGYGIEGFFRNIVNFPENARREDTRSSAMYFIILGAIISFIGIGMRASSRKY
jgi:hypothetical protein